MVLAVGSSMGWNLFRGSCTAKSCTEASYSVRRSSRTPHSRCDYDRFALGKGDRCFQPQLLNCVSGFEEDPTRDGFWSYRLTAFTRSGKSLPLAGRSQQPGGGGGVNRKSGGIKQAQLG